MARAGALVILVGACGNTGSAGDGSGVGTVGNAASTTGASAISSTSTGRTDVPPVVSECGGDTGDEVVPPVPEGCTQVLLVGPDGQQDAEAPAGLYTCPAAPWPTVYRSAAVTCLADPDAECMRDCDCGPGRACLCRSTISAIPSHCIDADCTGHGDCAGAHQCKGSVQPLCQVVSGLRCTTEADECATSDDCPELCNWNAVEEFWSCDELVFCE